MLKFINYIPLALTYFLPFALLTGPAIPDILIVTISISFILRSFYAKDFYWTELPIVRIFALLWLSLIFISFFSYNKVLSFSDSIIFVRFFIFAIAISYWIITDVKKAKVLFLIVFISICILLIDGIFQLLTYSTEHGFGSSIFGFKAFVYGRMTGPFNDEIIGSYIAKFFFMSLLFIYLIKNEKLKQFIFFIFFNLGFLVVFFSGERMALATLLLGSVILLINKELRVKIFFNLLVCFLIIFLSGQFHKSFNDFKIIEDQPEHLGKVLVKEFPCSDDISKSCNKIIKVQPSFLKVINNFDSSVYFAIYNSAIKMWLDNPFTGIGLNNFEFVCESLAKYKLNSKNYGECSAHPHNFYLQWLTEGGIFIFLLFIIFVIKLIYPTVHIINNLSSSIAFASLVTVLWPFMSTGSLLKNHHGIQVFFVISLCFIIIKHKNEL